MTTQTNQQAMAVPPLEPAIYDFDLNDFGLQPEWEKEALEGIGIVIKGLSESQFEGDFDRPARSVLYNLMFESQQEQPYGMFFSEDSVVVRHVKTMVERGHIPFRAVLRRKESQSRKGFNPYWYLDKYVQQYGADGEPV